MESVPYGYCRCGCGERTSIAKANDATKGYVKGEPLKWVRFHKGRRSPFHPNRYTVDPNTGCWVWNGTKGTTGYGRVCIMGREYMAHRVYYTDKYTEIPVGMDIDHLCRNRACVNPDHMEPVTRQVNAQRGVGPKLSVRQVRDIKKALATETQGRIAKRYGVSIRTIWEIANGHTWSNIT